MTRVIVSGRTITLIQEQYHREQMDLEFRKTLLRKLCATLGQRYAAYNRHVWRRPCNCLAYIHYAVMHNTLRQSAGPIGRWLSHH